MVIPGAILRKGMVEPKPEMAKIRGAYKEIQKRLDKTVRELYYNVHRLPEAVQRFNKVEEEVFARQRAMTHDIDVLTAQAISAWHRHDLGSFDILMAKLRRLLYAKKKTDEELKAIERHKLLVEEGEERQLKRIDEEIEAMERRAEFEKLEEKRYAGVTRPFKGKLATFPKRI